MICGRLWRHFRIRRRRRHQAMPFTIASTPQVLFYHTISAAVASSNLLFLCTAPAINQNITALFCLKNHNQSLAVMPCVSMRTKDGMLTPFRTVQAATFSSVRTVRHVHVFML